ncbi:MAG: hypothetical protein QM820_00380 [Minicystis sp.]
MYRMAPAIPGDRIPWLFRRAERAAALAFVVGTVASQSALGIAARSAEDQAYGPADILNHAPSLWFTVLSVAIPAVVWGIVIRIALSLRRGFDTALVVVAAVALTMLSLFEAMVAGGRHGQSTILQSVPGWLVAVLLDALRAASFGGVAALVQRVADGDEEYGPLDAAAAAWAWAAVFSLIGALLGPGVLFQVPSLLMLAVALAVLIRIHAVAVQHAGAEDLAKARAGARSLLRRSARAGVLPLAIAGGLAVPVRLYEQIATTRNPAMMAIFKSHVADNCDLSTAGREGDIRLWLVQCGASERMVGWDERARELLLDEKLYQRVPRLRSLPRREVR